MYVFWNFFRLTALVGQGLFISEVSRSHTDTWHLVGPPGMGLAFLAFSRHQIQFKTDVYSITLQQLNMFVRQLCMKDQNQHVKGGLGVRMYSVLKCSLYESQMSKSRGLPVLCLVTLKINKCETVTLKSLFVRCVQLKPIPGTVLAV
jgi:hypothetical protein